MILKRKSVDERLRDRLDRKQVIRVADLVNLAIGCGQSDAEQTRVGLGQLWNVGCGLAAEVWLVFGMDLPQRCQDR